ncbi:MAG: hypothetical protein WC768_03120 [Patescibacteria group bacterium]|jgi:hypothetical protein
MSRGLEFGKNPMSKAIELPSPENEEDHSIRGRQILGRSRFFANGRAYGLGSQFENDTVVRLEGNTYGIAQTVDGEPKITHLFQIPENQNQDDGKRYFRINNDQIFDLSREIPSSLETALPVVDDYNQRLAKDLVIESGQPKKSLSEKRQQAAEKLSAYLEQKNLVEYGPEGEIICDPETIAGLSSDQLESDRVNLPRLPGKKNEINWQTAALDFFKDKLVYSKKDWQKKQEGEEINAKPLFYLPSKREAFDINQIKKGSFYLSFSDIGGTWSTFNDYCQRDFGYSAEEAELALKIYHPEFGSGYRDETGKLMVKKSPGSEKFMPLNSDWITNKAVRFRGQREEREESGIKVATRGKTKSGNVIANWSSPKKAILSQEYDNLRQSGILRMDDFSQYEGSNTSILHRDERRITSRAGKISISTTIRDRNGKEETFSPGYVLGSRLEGKLLVKLTDGLYGIVDEVQGLKRMTHIFHPASPEMIQKKIEAFEARKGRKPVSADIFFGLEDDNSPKLIPFNETELSPKRDEETTEEYAERVATFNAVREYNKLEQISKDLTEQAGIGIHNLSFREQNALATYAFKSDKNYGQAIGFAKKFGNDGLKTFLACEYGLDAGDKIIDLGESLSSADAEKIFAAYNEQISQAQKNAQEIFAEIQQSDPQTVISIENIMEALTARGKDLLIELHQGLSQVPEKDRSNLVEKFLGELKKETPDQKAVRSQFKKIAGVFGGKEINLAALKKSQTLVLRSLENEGGTANLLRTLQRFDRLKPIPEIHWRVDRTSEEYNRRLGLNITDFLGDIAPSQGKKILLEFGPGSGMSKKQRFKAGTGYKYDEFAMADCVYYPIEPVISQLIDFEKIENDLGIELPPEEKRALTEFIYKTIYIKAGQSGADQFEYDEETIAKISQDPNFIKNALIADGEKLAAADAIPQTISSRDATGRVIYPYKILSGQQSENWQKAKADLA